MRYRTCARSRGLGTSLPKTCCKLHLVPPSSQVTCRHSSNKHIGLAVDSYREQGEDSCKAISKYFESQNLSVRQMAAWWCGETNSLPPSSVHTIICSPDMVALTNCHANKHHCWLACSHSKLCGRVMVPVAPFHRVCYTSFVSWIPEVCLQLL